MNITFAGEGDFDRLRELKLLSKKEEAKYSETLKPLAESEAQYLEYLRIDLARPDRMILMASENDEPIGMALVKILDTMDISKYDRKGYVSNVYVLPEHRGRGIGSDLLQKALDWLKEQGVTYVSVEVHAENAGAQKLYKKFGFGDYTVKLSREL